MVTGGAVRHLWVLRHAKAVPHGSTGGDDYARSLVARGRRDALALGTRLAAGSGTFGLDGSVALPEIVLCSAAARTSQTAELVVEGLGAGGGTLPSIEAYRSLYQAGTGTVVQYIHELDDTVTSAMVVGHNPTIYRLAWELLPAPSGEGGDSAVAGDRDRLQEHGFATCSVAVLSFAVPSWSEVTEGSGSLAGVFSPPF